MKYSMLSLETWFSVFNALFVLRRFFDFAINWNTPKLGFTTRSPIFVNFPDPVNRGRHRTPFFSFLGTPRDSIFMVILNFWIQLNWQINEWFNCEREGNCLNVQSGTVKTVFVYSCTARCLGSQNTAALPCLTHFSNHFCRLALQMSLNNKENWE